MVLSKHPKPQEVTPQSSLSSSACTASVKYMSRLPCGFEKHLRSLSWDAWPQLPGSNWLVVFISIDWYHLCFINDLPSFGYSSEIHFLLQYLIKFTWNLISLPLIFPLHISAPNLQKYTCLSINCDLKISGKSDYIQSSLSPTGLEICKFSQCVVIEWIN